MNTNLDFTSIIKRLNYRDLIIFIFPILIFLVLYLFSFNPGILTVDSFNILHQIAIGQFTNANPIFYTFIVMICLKIYASPITVGIFQILVFSLIWMIICKYHRDDSTSDQFVLQFVVTFIISLIPINAVNSITLSNLTLFSYSLMFLCFLIKIMVDEQGKLNLKWIIIMAITIALVSSLNNYGIYIGLISLILIVAYMFYENQSQDKLILLSALTIICILLIASLNIVYDVRDGQNLNIESEDSGINLENAKNQYFSSIHENPTESIENVSQINLRTTYFNQVNSFVNTFHENTILNTIFNNPFVYMILAIISLVYIQSITKSNLFIVYMPNLINIIIVFITSPKQFNFSLYSNLLVFYLIILILLKLWSNNDIKYISTDSNLSEKNIESDEKIYEKPSSEIEEITLEELNTILEESSDEKILSESKEPSDKKVLSENKESSEETDLIDQILKEIEQERDNE